MSIRDKQPEGLRNEQLIERIMMNIGQSIQKAAAFDSDQASSFLRRLRRGRDIASEITSG